MFLNEIQIKFFLFFIFLVLSVLSTIFTHKIFKALKMVVILITFGILLTLIYGYDELPIFKSFYLNYSSIKFLRMISLVGMFLSITNGYKNDKDIIKSIINLIIVFAALVLLGATDLITFWIGVELLSLMEIYYYQDAQDKEKFVYKYVLQNLITNIFFLLAAGLFYVTTKGLDLYDFNSGDNKIFTLSVCLFLIVTLVKIGLFPFHSTMFKLFEIIRHKAIIPNLVMIKTTIIFGLINFIKYLLGKCEWISEEYIIYFILSISVITSFFGALVSITERNIKRIIASFYISNLGLIFVNVCINDNKKDEGLIFYLISFSLAMAMLLVGISLEKNIRRFKIHDRPYLKDLVVFILVMLFLCTWGVFPSAVLTSKYLIFVNLFDDGLNISALLMLISSFTSLLGGVKILSTYCEEGFILPTAAATMPLSSSAMLSEEVTYINTIFQKGEAKEETKEGKDELGHQESSAIVKWIINKTWGMILALIILVLFGIWPTTFSRLFW